MTEQHPLKAIGFFTAAVLLISVVDAVCKIYTADLHAVQLVWGYFVGINLTLAVYFVVRGERLSGLLKTERRGLQFARPAFLAGSITSLFIGLTYLPIAETTAIGFTAPLFITALSVPLLKEKVGFHRWAAVLIGLAGVLIIVRPGGGLWHWASIMPLVGAMFFAGFQLITRVLASTERTHVTLFHTGIGGLFWTSLMVPFFWTEPTLVHWAVFIGTGVMGALAHLCMISAFNRAEASLLAPHNYTKIIWVAVLGYVLFDDVPSLNMWVGTAVIVSAGVYVLYRERRGA
ncbi:MAG: DMT family transporter [Alphaproteobacteria bacterium]|nr:DMT family transporter [Alphaproteobacteria bacterium]